MRLSKTAAQAALSMAYLASRSQDGLIQARTIGEHLNIPTDSALKILQALSRRGLILSQLGRSGGYRIQREASDVTLLEIVEAIDGPISAEIPVTSCNGQIGCSIDKLHGVCKIAAECVRRELAQITVADLNTGEVPVSIIGSQVEVATPEMAIA